MELISYWDIIKEIALGGSILSKDRKERLQEKLDKLKQKRIEEDERREYERVLEVVNDLFPNHIENNEEVEILSKVDSDKIKDELFEVFPFNESGMSGVECFTKI